MSPLPRIPARLHIRPATPLCNSFDPVHRRYSGSKELQRGLAGLICNRSGILGSGDMFGYDSLLANAVDNNPHQSQCRYGKKYSRDAADFTTGKYAEDHQQWMQLDSGGHQIRIEKIILEKPVNAQE